MKIMSIDDSVLEFMGGIEQNSLSHLLRYNENDDDSLEIIQNSHYYDNDFLTSHLKSNADKFCILSTNIQAVKSKFNELEAFVHKGEITLWASSRHRCWGWSGSFPCTMVFSTDKMFLI